MPRGTTEGGGSTAERLNVDRKDVAEAVQQAAERQNNVQERHVGHRRDLARKPGLQSQNVPSIVNKDTPTVCTRT